MTINSNRVEGWVNLASVQMALGSFEDAVESAARAVALKPGFSPAFMVYGDALRETCHWDEAFIAYRRAVNLERSPAALNRLGCALRAKFESEKAEALYLEVIEKAPGFTLAQVNLATLYAELHRYDRARELLKQLQAKQLPTLEQVEVSNTLFLLEEQERLQPTIDECLEKRDCPALLDYLTQNSSPGEPDEPVLAAIGRYGELSLEAGEPTAVPELPPDWPVIEALFMIPLIETVDDYLAFEKRQQDKGPSDRDLKESLNMIPVIEAVRESRELLQDPLQAECQLRYWHALACEDVAGLYPGHFKNTQNRTRSSPGTRHAEPAKTAATVREYAARIYPNTIPGLHRGLVSWMAICDIHAFGDGNGRLGISWMNRELEWVGEVPLLLNKEDGIRGAISAAANAVRSGKADLTALLPVVSSAQQRTRDFCQELAARRGH